MEQTTKIKAALGIFLAVFGLLTISLLSAPATGQTGIGQDSRAAINEQTYTAAQNAVAGLRALNISANRLESDLLSLRQAVDNHQETNAAMILNTIMAGVRQATTAKDTIFRVEGLVKKGESQMLDMKDAKDMLRLAKAAAARQDFAESLKRAGLAETMAYVQLSKFNFAYWQSRYWWAEVAALIALFFGTLMYRKARKMTRIAARMRRLLSEEDTVLSQMREAGKEIAEASVGGAKISNSAYHRQMHQHLRRLREIRGEILKLRIMQTKKIGTVSQKAALNQEEESLNELLKKTQEDHFLTKTKTAEQYHVFVEGINERLAEIEEARAVIEAIEKHKTTKSEKTNDE